MDDTMYFAQVSSAFSVLIFILRENHYIIHYVQGKKSKKNDLFEPLREVERTEADSNIEAPLQPIRNSTMDNYFSRNSETTYMYNYVQLGSK